MVTGRVSTLGGSTAGFNGPAGVCVGSNGFIYVADGNNNTIKRISPTGVVTTVAGSGVAGATDGIGTAARFNNPSSITIDAANNLYVTDKNNNRIRKITPAGVVTTIAGSGASGYLDGQDTAARFNGLEGIALDGNGNLYVTESVNNRIRKISPSGLVTTVAGGGSQFYYTTAPASDVILSNPVGIALDGSGNIYFADQWWHVIRKIDPSGIVTTLAGNFLGTFQNGSGQNASFSWPTGICTDAVGNVYVADNGNNRIRLIKPSGGCSITPPLPEGLTLDEYTGTISGTPTAASPLTTYTITAANSQGSTVSTLNLKTTGLSVTSRNPSGSICRGANVAINYSAVDVSGATSILVQLSNKNGSFANPTIIGTSNNLSSGTINAVIPVTLAYGGSGYRIRLATTGLSTNLTSNSIPLELTVGPVDAELAISPSGTQNICVGNSVNLNVPYDEFSSYQWYYNNTLMPGSTNNDLNTNVAGNYTVYVTNLYNCGRMSKSKTVNVNSMPVATFTVSSLTSGNKKLYASQSGAQYQWYMDGNLIPGATARSYTATMSGSYHLVVTRLGCNTTGTATAVTVGSSLKTLLPGEEVTETNDLALAIYPNPATSMATIQVQSEDVSNWNIRVLDLSGRVVEELSAVTGGEYQFGSSLAPGLYTIHATDGRNRLVEKWVKQ